MATQTVYIALGSRRVSGGRDMKEATAANADVTVTVNLSTVLTRGDFMRACEQVASQLSGSLK